MKKNLTEMVFILDRSGSMSGLEADTIGGFNSMIARQRAAGPRLKEDRGGFPNQEDQALQQREWVEGLCTPGVGGAE